jgi:hypothetical protein
MIKNTPQFKICSLSENHSDFDYWNEQSREKRLETLEEIRREYNSWRYGARQEFQRVYRIIKLQ